MRDLLFVIILMVFFLYGWYLMKKLDHFLEENWKKGE